MELLSKVNVPQYHRERHACLGDSPSFIDERFLLLGLFTPDLFMLEEWLVRKHGRIPDDTSLKDFIVTHYGEAAVMFVRTWFLGMPHSRNS